MNEDLFEKFFKGYLVAALWSSQDPYQAEDAKDDGFLDRDYTIRDFTATARIKLESAARKFFQENWDLLRDYATKRPRTAGEIWELCGNDYWLNANGHGAGFFDFDLEVSNRLSELCKSEPAFTIFVTEEDQLEVIE